MADSTLNAIKTMVRRVTRTPSLSQLSEEQLEQYINTFILYEFPSTLRLFNLRTVLTFYTQPFVDTYETNTTDITDPLYNFKNKYIAVHPPLFLAGVPGFYTQQRDVFYGYWPQFNTIANLPGAFGNNTTGPFTGVVTAHPMLANNVIVSCLDISGEAMILVDYPVSNQLGALGRPNEPQTIPSPYGQINYVTGAITVTFPGNTQPMAPVEITNIAYQPGKPLSVLYYEDKFTIRPVPDKVYAVQIEADIRPTELLANNQSPELEQWWQYIAMGASRLVFRDRMDTESINQITPELMRQETMVLRTTLTQQANERTVTIYTQGKNYGFGWFGPGGWPY
jgi:hypothetical protein